MSRLLIACVAAASLVAVRPAAAQQVFDVATAKHIQASYVDDLDSLHVKFMALANAIPAEKYSWRPEAGVRSVSEVLMHVAGGWYFWGPRSVAANAPADFGNPRDKLAALEKITDKAAVIAEFEKAWTYGRAQIAGVDPATLTGVYKPWNVSLDQAALSMTGDLHEHLGQLIAYARSLGVTPPWSKKE